jgi:hypothetical protein
LTCFLIFTNPAGVLGENVRIDGQQSFGIAPVSRRRFVHLALLAGGAVTASSLFPCRSPILLPPAGATGYRLQPLPGLTYSPSFLRFCRRARFTDFSAAVAAVIDPSLCFAVIVEPAMTPNDSGVLLHKELVN